MSQNLFMSLNFVQQIKYILRYRKAYRLILSSQVISLIGDWLSYVAMSLIILQNEQSSAFDLAMIFVAHALPNAIFAPLTGVIADRINRRSIMILISCVSALSTLALLYCAYHDMILIMQIVLFARTSMSCFANTARQASIAQIVYEHELYIANTFFSMMWSILFTVGVALGGFLCDLVGVYWTIALDSMTFVIAFMILSLLPQLDPQKDSILEALSPKDELKKVQEVQEVQDSPNHIAITKNDVYTSAHVVSTPLKISRTLLGLTEIEFKRSGILKIWQSLKPFEYIRLLLRSKSPNAALTSIGLMVLNLLLIVRYGTEGATMLGILYAARGLGTALGPIVLKKYLPRYTHDSNWITLIAIIIFVYSTTPWMHLLCLCIWGMGTGHNWVLSSTFIQSQATSGILGRLTAIDFLFLTLIQSIMSVVFALLYDAHFTMNQCVFITVTPIVIWLLKESLTERSLIQKQSSHQVTN